MGRTRRFWGVAGLGILLLLALSCGPPPEEKAKFDAEVEQFADMESKTVDIYNDAIDKTNSKEMTDDQFMQLIEEKILPDWRAMRKRLQDLKFTGAQGRRIEKLERYAAAREKGWVTILDGLHQGDSAKVDQGFAEEDEAEKILD